MSTVHSYRIIFPDGTISRMMTETPIQIGEEFSLPNERKGREPSTSPVANHLIGKIFQVVRVCREICEMGDAPSYCDSITLVVYLQEV